MFALSQYERFNWAPVKRHLVSWLDDIRGGAVGLQPMYRQSQQFDA